MQLPWGRARLPPAAQAPVHPGPRPPRASVREVLRSRLTSVTSGPSIQSSVGGRGAVHSELSWGEGALKAAARGDCWERQVHIREASCCRGARSGYSGQGGRGRHHTPPLPPPPTLFPYPLLSPEAMGGQPALLHPGRLEGPPELLSPHTHSRGQARSSSDRSPGRVAQHPPHGPPNSPAFLEAPHPPPPGPAPSCPPPTHPPTRRRSLVRTEGLGRRGGAGRAGGRAIAPP